MRGSYEIGETLLERFYLGPHRNPTAVQHVEDLAIFFRTEVGNKHRNGDGRAHLAAISRPWSWYHAAVRLMPSAREPLAGQPVRPVVLVMSGHRRAGDPAGAGRARIVSGLPTTSTTRRATSPIVTSGPAAPMLRASPTHCGSSAARAVISTASSTKQNVRVWSTEYTMRSPPVGA